MVVSLAQLSDPHLTTGPLGAERAAALHQALGRVLTVEPRPRALVITGDLTERGDADEYEVLRELVRTFPLPVRLLPGNHDSPRQLAESFGGTAFLGGGHATHYGVEEDGFALAALDSHLPGEPGGRLGGDQLAWLAGFLERTAERPSFVCLHHPPVPLGIPLLDGMRLADGAQLAAVVAEHPQVMRVLAGHVHRHASTAFAGTELVTAPSTYRQSALGLTAEHPMGYLHEPTQVLLHVLTEGSGAAGCVTHTVSVSHSRGSVGAF